MRIGQIWSSAEYRMDKKLQNSPIFNANVFNAMFWFSKLKEL